ncbi:DUF4374 domain-containing protein [Polaribacter sp. Hel_I_88]|uniref:DUF4374 domain-containing protein n=1 Tax=Polaribacter sp. Hel_I_88 TaxID=1250006 RepID=UPI000479D7CF|nr:DUF4374 domain-containing protein [Polaribacter sp. Hel_I_88]
MTITKNWKNLFFILSIAFLIGCDDDNTETPDNNNTEKQFVLGIGVTTPTETTNFLLSTDDLMTGTLSLQGQGTLQDGYRDYGFGANTFYSIGGLGVTDVNTVTTDGANGLNIETGLTFPFQLDGFREANGVANTMVGISLPQSPSTSENITFYNVNISGNSITNSNTVPVRDVYNETTDWIFTTGMQVRGNKLFQTFYPIDNATFTTNNTDTQYVAIYNYPAFTLDKVITDTRFGPAGAFNTRSGIFVTETGDIYTVSNSNFGFTQATKPAGILKIEAGSETFNEDYTFNTETAANGGKIIHAIYVGDNKLFAEVSTKVLEEPDGSNGFGNVYTDSNLHLAIVDLVAKTITKVAGAPEFIGNGGRSFAAFKDGNVVYSSIKDANGIVNIYQTNLDTATAIKGAQVDATFVGGIARIR